jgi:hypothetical protein
LLWHFEADTTLHTFGMLTGGVTNVIVKVIHPEEEPLGQILTVFLPAEPAGVRKFRREKE